MLFSTHQPIHAQHKVYLYAGGGLGYNNHAYQLNETEIGSAKAVCFEAVINATDTTDACLQQFKLDDTIQQPFSPLGKLARIGIGYNFTSYLSVELNYWTNVSQFNFKTYQASPDYMPDISKKMTMHTLSALVKAKILLNTQFIPYLQGGVGFSGTTFYWSHPDIEWDIDEEKPWQDNVGFLVGPGLQIQLSTRWVIDASWCCMLINTHTYHHFTLGAHWAL